MKITIPFGKGIPLEIDDAKVPQLMDTLLEKVLPNASKHLENLKAMGLDLTPTLKHVLRADSTPPAQPTTETPSSQVMRAPPGYIVDEHGNMMLLANLQKQFGGTPAPQPQAPAATGAPQPQPATPAAPRNCRDCVLSDVVSGQANIQICGQCAIDPARPRFVPRPR